MSLFKRTQKIVDNSRRDVELGDKSVFVERNHGTINVNVDMPALNKLFEELRGSFGTDLGKYSNKIEHIIEDKIEAQILNIRDEISENGKAVVEVINERIAELCDSNGKKHKALTEQIGEIQARLTDKGSTADEIKSYIEKAQKQSKAAADKLEKSVIDRIDALSKQIEQAATEIKEHTTVETDRILSAMSDRDRRQYEILLSNLNDEVTADYIEPERIEKLCEEILSGYNKHDFLARFYRLACGKNLASIRKFVNDVDPKTEYKYIEQMLEYIISRIDADILLLQAIETLMTRAYERSDSGRYAEWTEKLNKAKEDLDNSIYDPYLSRDCFVAYSGAQIEYAEQLVEYLTEQGLCCFMAKHNLRHGSRSDYEEKIKIAIEHCSVFVLVSSDASRQTKDVRNLEMKHVMDGDYDNAPAEYRARKDYPGIPYKLKMPRIEYIIEPYKNKIYERYINDFFRGYDNKVYADINNPESAMEKVAEYVWSVKDNTDIPGDYAPPPKAEQKIVLKKESVSQVQLKPQAASSEIKEAFMRIKADLMRIKEKEEMEKKAEAELLERQAAEERAKKEAVTRLRDAILCVNIKKDREARAKKFAVARLKETLKCVKNKKEKEVKNAGITISNCNRNEFVIDGTILTKYKGKGGHVIIPHGVTSIGNHAFAWCGSLTNIEIPNSVMSIGSFAFSDCSGLTSITIPNSVEIIDFCAFNNCGSLSKIEVASNNTKYHSADNCLIETSSKTLICGCKNSIIPTDGSVIRIGNFAFSWCSSLMSIEIPNRVMSIGFCAFNSCSELTSVMISGSVTSIDDMAFSYCPSLEVITYKGTKAQWKAIKKDDSWKKDSGKFTVHCTDGTLSKSAS